MQKDHKQLVAIGTGKPMCENKTEPKWGLAQIL